MSITEAEAPAEDPARPRFRVTTGETPHEPTVRPWELELLISGAVTFALLQLPGRVDAWYAALRPQLDTATSLLVMLAYTYGKLILYVLIGSFSVHLAARAYWVGLIGLESVFPQGVRWDETKYGPVAREVYEERLGRLQPHIDRADRFCSVIFPAAFAVATLFLYTSVTVGLVVGLSFLVARTLGDGYLGPTYFIFLLAWTAFATGTGLIDKYLGEKLAPGGPGRRRLRRAVLVLYYATGAPLFGIVVSTLLSNLPKKVFYTGLWVGLLGLTSFGLLKDVFLRNSSWGLDGYDFVPEGGSRTQAAGHYENLRPPAEASLLPSIQADVVTGPYLRLFIPYAPRRLNEVFRERCPAVPSPDPGIQLASSPADTVPLAQQQALLGCWARLQPIRLDGRPISPVFRFFEHPRTGLRGKIAYIPVTGLAAGEHVLEVEDPPRPARQRDRPMRPPHRIPFWR